MGQQEIWEKKEMAKSKKKTGYPDMPYGNAGPGEFARVQTFSKAGSTFRWERERAGQTFNCKTRIPTEKLFNVSAYKPGDFMRFFSDPRTRADYIEWAPYLLAAEEFHAGNKECGPSDCYCAQDHLEEK